MEPHEILTTSEFYEPETIRTIFPTLSDTEYEQLQVLQVLTYNSACWQDLFIFENVVLALNGIKPEVSFLQGCTPSQIWYAVKLLYKAFPERIFDPEIKYYIQFMSRNYGLYVYPPEIFNKEENPLYDEALNLLNSKKVLTDKDSINIQAANLGAIQLYIRLKEDDEKIKLNLEKKGEEFYTPSEVLGKSGGGGRMKHEEEE